MIDKTCKKCLCHKSADSFRKNRNSCRDCENAGHKIWREANPKHSTKWYRKNIEHARELDRIISKRPHNRQSDLEKSRRRKAKRNNNGYEIYTDAEVILTYGTTCHLCGFAIDMNAPRQVGKPGWQMGLHIDHVIPIALGGPDTLENVRPAHGLCNSSKGAKIC